MNHEEFRQQAHRMVDWMADYLANIEDFPVKPNIAPKHIFNQIATHAPDLSESMDDIFADFQRIIPQGMTHWQHPCFFAYFPANASPPSLLAEMLTATLAAQCMMWDTSPAATELEEMMMRWLQQLIGLPDSFEGVLQDTASAATLCAILSARERSSQFQVNEHGFTGQEQFRVYCSQETHSSIEKAVKIAGLGKQNLVKIAVNDDLSIKTDDLERAIDADLRAEKRPICVVAALGTTGTTAVDDLATLANICQRHGLWLHIDAAYAGSALILEEYRHLLQGIEQADSFVFNPHKWLFTNFDCTAYFVRDKETLKRTFSILPEYLRSQNQGQVNDYRDWGIALGRRFRALKLWFVMRNFGKQGLQEKIHTHIQLAQNLASTISQNNDYQLLAPTNFNLVCFRFAPKNIPENALDALNEQLLHNINASGKAYLSHTKIHGKYAIRMVIGQTNVTKKHVDDTWLLLQMLAKTLIEKT